MSDKYLVTHCPIHPEIPIRPHPEKYGPHKDEMMGWCPKCDVKFPVELSYQDLLRFYINLKRSHDELRARYLGKIKDEREVEE